MTLLPVSHIFAQACPKLIFRFSIATFCQL